MDQKKKKGSKGSAAGRNKMKCDRYLSYEHQVRVKERKLRRILKSEGPRAARNWASSHGATSLLGKIAKDSVNDESGLQGKIGRLATFAVARYT